MTREDKFSRLNNLYYDEFGRPNGILLVNKPAGISSHDVVNRTRKDLSFKKVGHAGALDVFASGLLLILIGRATKLSNDFLTKDKAYITRVVFGIRTTTQDPEGEIVNTDLDLQLTEPQVIDALNAFAGGYEQYVSIFSSVKVGGKKLRKVLRDPHWSYKVTETENSKTLNLVNKHDDTNTYTIEIPKRKINIYDIHLIKSGSLAAKDLPFIEMPKDQTYFYADIYVKCSKGTYIRQLGEDIGTKLNTVAALAELDRVELADWSKEDAIELDDIKKHALKIESVSL